MTRPIGFIPYFGNQSHTYAYFDGTVGIMNSKQLILGGESTCSGVFATAGIGDGGKALFSINELSRMALEQTSTARDAIQLMGTLAEEYGFYGPERSFEGSAESLMIADPHEGFVFHILPDDTGTSAIWVAKRVPDDEVTVVMNMFTIREVNLTDTYNFMGTEYMYEVAERNNIWKRHNSDDELLDFTKTFSNGEYSHKYYSGRRIWGAFHLLAPYLNLDPDYEHEHLKDRAIYPWSVKPDRLLTLEDIFAVHRYYYQGTKYDMTKGLAAGPFGDPDRFVVRDEQASEVRTKYNGIGSWERPIAMFRTTYTTVLQARSWLDDSIGGVMWLGAYAAHGTCFLPFAVGVDSLPESITQGSMTRTMDVRKSAFWTFRYMHTLSRLRYSVLSRVVRDAQTKWEGTAMELQQQLEIQSQEQKTRISSAILTEVYKNHTARVLEAWWKLADELVFLYADGFDNQKWDGPPIGYSTDWLEAVGYQNGPPPPHSNPSTTPHHTTLDKYITIFILCLLALIMLLLFIIPNQKGNLLLGHPKPKDRIKSPATPATATSESSALLSRYDSLGSTLSPNCPSRKQRR
jgi:dipeptidase